MKVLAKNTIGGRRYLTQKNVLVEVVAISKDDSRPRQAATGHILVWVVGDDGVTNTSRRVPIELSYQLTDPHPETLPPRSHKRGRVFHDDKTWRGWAYPRLHRPLPEAVLKAARDRECYLKPTANYITIGWNGVKLFSVFRDGNVAFSKLPEYFLGFEHKTVASRFSPIRISLRRVLANGHRLDFIKAVEKLIDDYKAANPEMLMGEVV
jgi:hypothetical protein